MGLVHGSPVAEGRAMLRIVFVIAAILLGDAIVDAVLRWAGL